VFLIYFSLFLAPPQLSNPASSLCGALDTVCRLFGVTTSSALRTPTAYRARLFFVSLRVPLVCQAHAGSGRSVLSRLAPPPLRALWFWFCAGCRALVSRAFFFICALYFAGLVRGSVLFPSSPASSDVLFFGLHANTPAPPRPRLRGSFFLGRSRLERFRRALFHDEPFFPPARQFMSTHTERSPPHCWSFSRFPGAFFHMRLQTNLVFPLQAIPRPA